MALACESVATDKRARQRANRAKKLEQEYKIERTTRMRQLVVTGVLIAAGVAAVVILLSFTGGETDDTATETDDTETETGDTDDATSTSSVPATSTTVEGPVSAVSTPEPGEVLQGTPGCPEQDGSSERVTQFDEAPPMCIDANATYAAVIETTSGTINIELDAASAPETVNNFVFLARYHYYDGVPFHRIIPGFMIQGGDAVGNPLGTGNPGYQIAEEPPSVGYQVGSVAMAKTAAPSSTGSQFFIVTGSAGEALPTEYSLFGQVTSGMDVVEMIEAIPTTGSDAPTEEIYITSVTITES